METIISVTKIILLHLLRNNDEVPITDVEETVTRITRTCGIITNESHYETRREIISSINQLNFYTRKNGCGECLVIENGTVKKNRSKCCNDILRMSIPGRDTLTGLVLGTIISCLGFSQDP